MAILFITVFIYKILSSAITNYIKLSKFLELNKEFKMESNYLTLIETQKSRDILSDNDYEEKIPYLQTFRFIKVTRYYQRKVCIYGIFSS